MTWQRELEGIANNYTDLERFVASEPRLAPFVPAAAILAAQARELAAGADSVAKIPRCYWGMRIPDRLLAVEIMARVHRPPEFPPVDAVVDRRLLLAYGQLTGNFVCVFMDSVFRDYPDLVPCEPATEDP